MLDENPIHLVNNENAKKTQENHLKHQVQALKAEFGKFLDKHPAPFDEKARGEYRELLSKHGMQPRYKIPPLERCDSPPPPKPRTIRRDPMRQHITIPISIFRNYPKPQTKKPPKPSTVKTHLKTKCSAAEIRARHQKALAEKLRQDQATERRNRFFDRPRPSRPPKDRPVLLQPPQPF